MYSIVRHFNTLKLWSDKLARSFDKPARSYKSITERSIKND